MTKPVVLIAEELSPATLDALGPDFEVRHVDGADRAALLPALADVDAVLIRSATKMDAEAHRRREEPQGHRPRRRRARQRRRRGRHQGRRHGRQRADLQHHQRRRARRRPAPRLRPQHRAGQRRPSRTARGSAASTAASSCSRRRSASSASAASASSSPSGSRASAWRSSPTTPTSRPQRAGQLGARLVTLDELLAETDFITVHLPKTPETVGLIGKEALHQGQADRAHHQRRPRRHRRRGGPRRRASREGRVAGAGIDVFATEPCTDSPLFEHESVVVTPHLGASTDEAQEKAGVAVAQVGAARARRRPRARRRQRLRRRRRRGGPPRHRPRREARPRLHRARRRGAGAARRRGARRDHRRTTCRCWELAALKGLFTDVVEDPVSYVNAPLLAEERGSRSRLVTDPESDDFRNVITLRGTLADGTQSRSPAR